jgi:hypothetical protein
MKWFGRKTEMRDFDEDTRSLGVLARSFRGTHPIPVAQVVGSVGRAFELRPNFMPILTPHGSFRYRQIKARMERGASLPPIDAYKLGDRYYVVDGHRRVAAARRVRLLDIDAIVTEFRPIGRAATEAHAA